MISAVMSVTDIAPGHLVNQSMIVRQYRVLSASYLKRLFY